MSSTPMVLMMLARGGRAAPTAKLKIIKELIIKVTLKKRGPPFKRLIGRHNARLVLICQRPLMAWGGETAQLAKMPHQLEELGDPRAV